MTSELVQLRNFSSDELLFDEQETRDILKFFFPQDAARIDTAVVTDELRNLAQGLLVEAVDASHAMGWVEQLFRCAANPGSGVKKALTKLVRRGARYWFRHAKRQGLIEAKVYERIRDQLSRNFRSPFVIILQIKRDRASQTPILAYVDYGVPGAKERAWG